MDTKIKKVIHSLPNRLLFFVIVVIFAFSLIPTQAIAATASTTAGNIVLDALKIFGANMGLPDTDPRIIVARIIRTVMGFVGIVLLLMFLYSGASFMLSGGDKEKVLAAKRTFFNAIIGIFIMLSAYGIVAFVLNALGTTNN